MAKEAPEILMTLDDIKTTIQKSLPDAEVHVFDPMRDGQHLEAIVICPAFEGVMLVKQHQMVMKPLKDALACAVHALALKTFTPEKWESARAGYGL